MRRNRNLITALVDDSGEIHRGDQRVTIVADKYFTEKIQSQCN